MQAKSEEFRYQYQQIVFGQLASYALNMRSFALPPATMHSLVRRLAIGNGLSDELLQTLIANADATSI